MDKNQTNRYQEHAIKYAKELIEQKKGCILDTETTGLDSEARICDIAIIDMDGNILLDTLVNPGIPIPEKLTGIHGISDDMVRDAPMWPEIISNVQEIFQEHQPLLIYNAPFDIRMLTQHSQMYGLDILVPKGKKKAMEFHYRCAMKLYGSFVGEIDYRHGHLKWHKLQDAASRCHVDPGTAHRALADCITTLGVIQYMAQQEIGQ